MQPTSKKETYNNLLGIDNVNDSTKIIKRVRGIPFVRLIQAENVDIHTDYHISRCNGYTLSKAGTYSSVWSNDRICLGINAGDLIQIHPDITTSVLMQSVGGGEMAYETVPDGAFDSVYFTNSFLIGKVTNGVASLLLATTREFKNILPAGSTIKFFQASVYVVRDKTVYISDVLNRGIYDRRWGFKLFESDIQMFEPVKDGIYVSDSNSVFFMKRTGSTQEVAAAPVFTLTKICDKAAVPGTGCKVFDVITPSEKKHEQAVIWVAGQTLYLGGDGGQSEAIRENVYEVPFGRTGTSVFRKSGDLKQYITIVR